jgi:hypothetical protein
LLACAVIEIAIIERRGTSTRLNVVVVALVAAYLPWLQVKNYVVAIILLAAFVVVRHRTRSRWRPTAVVSALCLISWVLMLVYNQRYFGHLLGLPEPGPSLSSTGVEYTLGLLIDRDQGLFVQLPFAVIGLLGMWMARKKVPVAVLATILSVGGILILNGTYISNPYGGLSLAGRFMWTAMPLLVAWTGIVLGRWEQAERRLWGPILVVIGAWLYQGIGILAGSHTYYNVFTQTPPWDPATWPGWWPGLNRILPQFDLPGHPLGAPAIDIFIALALGVVLAVVAWQYGRPTRLSKESLATVGALSTLVIVALFVVKPLTPTTTLTFDSTQLGAPVKSGDRPASSALVNLQGVLPGTYLLTLSYGLAGASGSGSMVVSCNASTGESPHNVVVPLHLGRRATSVAIQCADAGTVATQFHIAAHSELIVRSLLLRSAPSRSAA